jgi:hypothetical protein
LVGFVIKHEHHATFDQDPAMPRRLDRRQFFTGTAAAAAGWSLASAQGDSARAATIDGKTLSEAAREVPIVEEADVVVCGAGPAGFAAAIAAAEQGADTRLIEVGGCLGGVWTRGLLSWILDATNKRGLTKRLLEILQKRGISATYGSSVGYDVEQMKILLEQLCLEAGIKIRLHTRVVSAAKDDANRLALAVTESKSGREAFAGKVFIDATGDGDLAARAGCGFDYGHEETGRLQPTSMIVLLGGLDPEGVAPFVRGLAEPRGERNPKRRLWEEMARAGVEPSYGGPTLFYIRPGLFTMMANHEYGVSAVDAQQITDATLRSRAENHKLVDALRSLGGVWKDIQIIATPEQIGVREGRRIHGRYTVSTDDLAEGARHDDAVCRVYFGIDVHSTDPDKTKAIERQPFRSKPYDIPYRSLVAKDVDGLLTAGRCISGDFLAHSSYRVTGNSVALGEAAGAAAALAAKTNRLPHEVPWAEIAASREGLGPVRG